jgi:predicted lipoprotein with Yx(FWY)xxD motif
MRTVLASCGVPRQPILKDGVASAIIGTVQRKDGTMQVTYNGMPLYYFMKDQTPGSSAGQGVGQVWFVVTPDGNLVK